MSLDVMGWEAKRTTVLRTERKIESSTVPEPLQEFEPDSDIISKQYDVQVHMTK